MTAQFVQIRIQLALVEARVDTLPVTQQHVFLQLQVDARCQ
jgi:hypothetical protein